MNARRLPSITARDVITGSHYRLVHDADPTRQTTVPVHKGKDIPGGTLRDIIKQAGFSVDEFIDLL